jgi:hypothetical protein
MSAASLHTSVPFLPIAMLPLRLCDIQSIKSTAEARDGKLRRTSSATGEKPHSTLPSYQISFAIEALPCTTDRPSCPRQIHLFRKFIRAPHTQYQLVAWQARRLHRRRSWLPCGPSVHCQTSAIRKSTARFMRFAPTCSPVMRRAWHQNILAGRPG